MTRSSISNFFFPATGPAGPTVSQSLIRWRPAVFGQPVKPGVAHSNRQNQPIKPDILVAVKLRRIKKSNKLVRRSSLLPSIVTSATLQVNLFIAGNSIFIIDNSIS
ncbi:hypothetical protein LINPERPRIM_LOCUS2088 [Linum perenne]